MARDLSTFLEEGHDLEEWFPPPTLGGDATAIERGAFNIEAATRRDMMREESAATELAAMLAVYGWPVLSRALVVALRGQAEPAPPEPRGPDWAEEARLSDAYWRGRDDGRDEEF